MSDERPDDAAAKLRRDLEEADDWAEQSARIQEAHKRMSAEIAEEKKRQEAALACKGVPEGIATCEATSGHRRCPRWEFDVHTVDGESRIFGRARHGCPRGDRDAAEWRKIDDRRRRRTYLLDAGVPLKHVDAISDGKLAETAALEAVRAFLADKDTRILVLAGRPGVGKTVAAAASIAFYTGEGRFLHVSQLRRVNAYDEQEMSSLERVHLLVIDDLGTEFADAKGAFQALLDGLIDRRYSARCRTIITSNLAGATFKSRYGERVADRIREDGRFIEFAGESMRGKAG